MPMKQFECESETCESLRNWTHVVWEVFLELGDALAPVGGRFLTNELDVEEGALTGAEDRARRGAADDTRRYVGHQVLHK